MLGGALLLILTPQMVGLRLVAVGEIETALADSLSAGLARALPVRIVDRSSIPLPQQAYDPGRRQYSARIVLNEVLPPEDGLVLAVVSVDLYAAGLNFVFGQAEPGLRRAVISTIRLYPQVYGLPPDDELFNKRLLTEAVHEVGHLLGLSHCKDPACVMYFSNSLADTDRKGPALCESCRAKLSSR